ncbi:MAG TPA: KUP/HAK/KT family potassium transporter, partial [Candidatus Baltobacteraceae bacterium]
MSVEEGLVKPVDGAAPKALSGAIALAALGVVFGDIGTSPLYTLSTCFTTTHVSATPENVLGIVSALIWSLILVVCIKYVTFVMQVDHDGEGGIFALLAWLMPPTVKGVFPPLTFFTIVGLVGGAALFGDGIITPAISVLSAVEGLNGITTAATTWEVPMTVAILIALFVIQWRGTEKIGFLFGPVMALWFLTIAITGGAAIVGHPQILAAFDPLFALGFMTHHGIFGLL